MILAGNSRGKTVLPKFVAVNHFFDSVSLQVKTQQIETMFKNMMAESNNNEHSYKTLRHAELVSAFPC